MSDNDKNKHEPGMAYDTKFLNKLFAVLGVLFLFTTLWMVLDDYIRPWKAVQLKGFEVKDQVLKEKIIAEEKSIDQEKLNEINQEIEVAKKEVEAKSGELEKLKEELSKVQKDIYVQNMTNGTHGALAGEYQFKYEHYLMEGKEKKAAPYKKKMEKEKELFAQGQDDLKTFQQKESEINDKIKAIRNEVAELKKAESKIIGTKDRLVTAKKLNKRDPIFFLRNSPFIDYLDPTVKIHQVVLDNLTDDRYFVQTKKVDRCTTCHMFIDQPGYEDKPQPYRTHPKVNTLAVGTNSAHPIKKFGCTTCHGGEGHRVNDFNAPAHMPSSEEQQAEWEEKYHWHEPHKVPITMLPSKYSYASCTKCHNAETRVVMGDKLNRGKELVQSYGCYGCHKIEGWEHLKKPGPSLLKINAKVSKEFIKNWIWSPHTFNPKSRMPAFFGQSNNSKPEFMKKNIVEVNAMTEYIVSKAKDYQPFKKYSKGNAEKGKELIQTIGCVACHGVEGIDEPYSNVNAKRGPYLTGTGSKVDPDWLVSWLIKPSHYQADTVMPSFRLSDQEANDIATYLLNSKSKKFADLKFQEMDKKIRDELLVADYSAFIPIATAQAKVEELSDEERTIELGRISIGKYGCYSCHDIEGFKSDRPPIGPDLTKVGSKPIHQFGYGQQHQVGHTRHDWFTAHLKNPRMWDIGVPKPFKDLNRMPNFYLNDTEIEEMTTFLLGQVSEYVPMAGKKNYNERELIAEQGRKVANKYNCQGCHTIDGQGGWLSKTVYGDDLNAGPPWLVKEGHRVHADWLHTFLKEVKTIRPYMNVRMPSFNFSEGELNKLVDYFVKDADQRVFYEKPDKVTWEAGEREAAVKMWNELACVTCHTGGFNNEEAQGPNLHFAHERLRPSWVKKWLANPVGIQSYTPMPQFWGENGDESAVEGVLGDDPQKQIEAMKKYIIELGQKKGSYQYK